MNMPSACVYSAGDGNGKIGRQAAYVPDRCLRDGVGDRNGNSRLLAALIRRSPGRRQHQIAKGTLTRIKVRCGAGVIITPSDRGRPRLDNVRGRSAYLALPSGSTAPTICPADDRLGR